MPVGPQYIAAVAETPIFASFWFVVIAVVLVLTIGVWMKLRDRIYLYYAGYVGGFGLMSLVSHVLGPTWHERMGDGFIYLNNLLHLPYALAYLGFVSCYFNVREQAPGWARFHRSMFVAYAIVLVWVVFNWTTNTAGSEWGILGCNVVNLLASFVLAGMALRDNRPGAREFLYASLPLAVSGLVLIGQFLSNSTYDGGPVLLAFRTGFIMHVMIFLVALSVRYRELRLRLG